MENVKMLSLFLSDGKNPEKDVERKEFEDIVAFAKKRGFVPATEDLFFAPVMVEYELQKEISIDEALNLVREIEKEEKYEVYDFRFCTVYGGFENDESPFAGIYVTIV